MGKDILFNTQKASVLHVTGREERWPSDIITFDQNWHHLYSSPGKRKYLSKDTQIRVISPMLGA